MKDLSKCSIDKLERKVKCYNKSLYECINRFQWLLRETIDFLEDYLQKDSSGVWCNMELLNAKKDKIRTVWLPHLKYFKKKLESGKDPVLLGKTAYNLIVTMTKEMERLDKEYKSWCSWSIFYQSRLYVFLRGNHEEQIYGIIDKIDYGDVLRISDKLKECEETLKEKKKKKNQNTCIEVTSFSVCRLG